MTHIKNTWSAILIVILCFISTPCAGSDIITITMAGNQDNFNEYRSLISKHGKDYLFKEGIPHDSPARRIVAEMIIITRALKEGGINAEIEFISVPNARRETMEVAAGHAVICSQQFNKSTHEEANNINTLLLSDPITRYGEFEKGIYHLPDNHLFFNATDVSNINLFGSAIIGLHWNNDYSVLSNMNVRNIVRAPTYNALFTMLKAGRGDWIPLEFSNSPDLGITINGIKVVPVCGVKFSLLESRHFLVSKVHPLGQKVFDALQIGIKKLRKEGYIRKVLEQAGFFSTKTKSWKLLNADQIKKFKHTD